MASHPTVRLLMDGLAVLVLATVMHIDWHVARPVEHHLSLGWRWHWLLAVPVGYLTARYVQRTRSARPFAASVATIGIASMLAAVIEPAWEYWTGATYEWAFGRVRQLTFAAFLLTLSLTHAVVLLFSKRRTPMSSRT